ncbi:UDP-galactose transporter senju [Hetaerina americana]|uniref:UDP-galactose transporter senju n=1 Tax=Hetaerina americana TaxID=62018 RepID=UPI003A7F52F5
MLGSSINWKELFPTKCSVVVFVSYMALFINQGVLVKGSQEQNSAYNYNTVTVVLMTEVLKLVVSSALYCKDLPFTSLIYEVKSNLKVLMLYFVPALLYCLYNNLAFVNLAAFDPTSYYLLLQFRVVVTGVVYQLIFKRKLSGKQWVSLILLTAGCMIKQVDFSLFSSSEKTPSPFSNFYLNINAFLIFVQTVCSCLAGVYNEYLLKGEAEVNIFLQNVFMYIDSIICNAGILLIQGNFVESFSTDALKSLMQYKVLLIMINNAAIGIITSFFLKNLNSILKTFASALELMFTAAICWAIFGIPIYFNTVVAITIVSYAVILYSQNPVVNQVKSSGTDPSTEKLIQSV